MSLIIFFEENIKQYRTVFPIFLILAEDPPGFIEALNGVNVRLEDTNHILRSNIFKKKYFEKFNIESGTKAQNILP